MRKIIVLLVALAVFVVSCSSGTIIKSIPEGAKVYMNDEYKGVTPYSHSDTAIVGTAFRLKLSKEGYEDFQTIMKKDEKFNTIACVGGVFCLVPFLWVFEYNPERTYEMKKATPGKK